MKSLVSVIVPVYNLDIYIKKCIESIVNQTYKRLEIILVDDGSTDKSGILCDNYANVDSRVRVIHKKNEGLVRARKTGLMDSQGDYILPVDADDWIEPDMIEKMVSIMEQHQIDFAQCGLIWEFENGKNIKHEDLLTEGEYDLSKRENGFYENLFIRDGTELSNGIRLNICSCVFKREIMLSSQKLIDDNLKNGEDDACFFLAALDSNRFYKIDYGYYHACVRQKSMSRDRTMFSVRQVLLIENIIRPVLNRHIFREYLESFFNKYLLFLINLYAKQIWGYGFSPLYIFDIKMLPMGSRIVIYGAGMVGQSYYKQIYNRCNVVGWVDRNKTNVNGYSVDKVESVARLDYDFIILATSKNDIANEMCCVLSGLGVKKEKIIYTEAIK